MVATIAFASVAQSGQLRGMRRVKRGAAVVGSVVVNRTADQVVGKGNALGIQAEGDAFAQHQVVGHQDRTVLHLEKEIPVTA